MRSVLALRPFTANDQAPLSHVLEAAWPDDSTTRSYYRFGSTSAPDAAPFLHTLVAQHHEKIVGFGSIWTNRIHPYSLYNGVIVHPAYQGRGIGSALYTHLLHARGTYESWPMQTATWSDCPRAIAFLHRHGFHEDKRTYLPVIHVSNVDIDSWCEQRSAAAGYRIVNFTELPTTPERNQKIVTLATEIYRSTHTSNPPASLTRVQWEDIVLNGIIEAGCFVVLSDADYVGLSFLHGDEQADTAVLGWHGVARPYRSDERMIIRALVSRELAFAQEQGYTTIHAEIDTTDHWAMLLFDILPIKPGRAWITFRT